MKNSSIFLFSAAAFVVSMGLTVQLHRSSAQPASGGREQAPAHASVRVTWPAEALADVTCSCAAVTCGSNTIPACSVTCAATAMCSCAICGIAGNNDCYCTY